MSPEAEDDGAEVHDADTGELAARDAARGQTGQHGLRSRLYDDEAHAGGIATGRGMLAAMTLGADGVQMGSRFASSTESSAHDEFKRTIVETGEGDTQLTLKELAPVRLIKNKFFNDVQELYAKCPSKEDLENLLGKRRAKRGMFEGDLIEGELEIGQIAGLIHDILPVETIVDNIITEFNVAKQEVATFEF